MSIERLQNIIGDYQFKHRGETDIDPSDVYRLVFKGLHWDDLDIEKMLGDVSVSLEKRLLRNCVSTNIAAQLLIDAIKLHEATLGKTETALKLKPPGSAERNAAEAALYRASECQECDPEHKRQRLIARYILGVALNRLPKERPKPRLFERTQPPTRDELIEVALREGLVEYTPWHHAPMCPSNDWSKMMLPEGPCNCGAERQQHRLNDR
jgi:hypothetical protein